MQVSRNHTYILKSFVNDARVLKVVIREEVELVQKVPDIDTAKWVHLRKRQDTREAIDR